MIRPRTFTERYSAEYLAGLDSIICPDGEHRGARYCPLCRARYARQRRGDEL